MGEIKRVLMITSWPPLPVESGGQSATWRVLEYYLEMGFSIDLVSLVPKQYDIDTGQKLLSPYLDKLALIPFQMYYKQAPWLNYGWVLQSLLTGRSFIETKLSVPKAKRAIKAFLQERTYHLIHCEYPQNMQTFAQQDAPIVYFQHNIDYQHYVMKSSQAGHLFLKWFYAYQSRLIKKMETEIAQAANLVLCLGRDDRTQLIELGTRPKQTAIMNFRLENQFFPSTAKRRLISMGSLGDPKRAMGTRWFAKEVFPLIQRRVPDVEWHIVGRFPPRDLAGLHDGKSIMVHGYVPTEKLEQILKDTRVCVVPLFMGTGKQMKIDEMTQRGIPCVVTSNGARNTSLNSVKGEIFVSDDPKVFADDVIKLLQTSSAYAACRDRLAEAVARSKKYFDQFQKVLKETMKQNPPTTYRTIKLRIDRRPSKKRSSSQKTAISP